MNPSKRYPEQVSRINTVRVGKDPGWRQQPRDLCKAVTTPESRFFTDRDPFAVTMNDLIAVNRS
jgi:chemotaxis methyl-accepting protein methylase